MHFTSNKVTLAFLCTFGIIFSLLAGFLSEKSSEISKMLYNLEEEYSELPKILYNMENGVEDSSGMFQEKAKKSKNCRIRAASATDLTVDPEGVVTSQSSSYLEVMH